MLEGRSLEKAFCRNHKFHLKKNLPIEELMERFGGRFFKSLKNWKRRAFCEYLMLVIPQ